MLRLLIMERNILFSFILMAVLGCSKAADPLPVAMDDTGPTAFVRTCDVTVRETIPSTGSMDHYYRDPVMFKLSGPIEEAQVLTDVAGETTLSEDGETVIFTPDGVFSPSTEYSMALEYCYGVPEISFTTSHYGAPIEASSADALQGSAFVLNFTSGRYTIGENAGDLLNSVFTRNVLVQFEDVRDVDAQIVAAIGKPNDTSVAQDFCARTIAVEASIESLPLVTGEEVNFSFGAMGGQLRIDEIEFEATLSSDLQTIGGLRYQATIGMTELVDLLPEFGGESVSCDLAANLGIPCEPCPSNSSLQCITIAAEGVDGSAIDVGLEVIAAQGEHPECDAEGK